MTIFTPPRITPEPVAPIVPAVSTSRRPRSAIAQDAAAATQAEPPDPLRPGR